MTSPQDGDGDTNKGTGPSMIQQGNSISCTRTYSWVLHVDRTAVFTVSFYVGQTERKVNGGTCCNFTSGLVIIQVSLVQTGRLYVKRLLTCTHIPALLFLKKIERLIHGSWERSHTDLFLDINQTMATAFNIISNCSCHDIKTIRLFSRKLK